MRHLKPSLLLVILAGLLLAAPALAYFGPATMKLTIVNHTGYSDEQVWLALIGKPIKEDNSLLGYYQRMSMPGQTMVQCLKADSNALTVQRPDGTDYPVTYCNYGFKLKDIKDPVTGAYSLTFPHMNGGRLWIAFHRQVYFRMNDDALGLAEPTTDPAADDPNPLTFFDKFEFTFDYPQDALGKDAWLHANTTNVDFLAIPMLFEEKDNSDPPVSLGKLGFTSGRGTLVQALSADPVLRPLTTPYRFNSPKEKFVISEGLRHHFDAYVNYCWSLYPDTDPAHPLTISGTTKLGGAFTANGLVNSTTQALIFTIEGIPGETHTIPKPVCTPPATDPSSWDVFACAGVFVPTGANATAPDQRDGFLKTAVSAALNRSVMHKPVSDWNNINYFYTNTITAPNQDKFATNNYAKILHDYSLQKKCYAFPYDDKGGWNCEIDAQAYEVVLTLNNCNTVIAPMNQLLLGGD